METLMETLFFTAGIAMFVHVLLCHILRKLLHDYPDLVAEYFAIPNEILTRGSVYNQPRLLRVRYYWPWTATNSDGLDSFAKFVFLSARITGLLVPVCFLGFLISIFCNYRN